MTTKEIIIQPKIAELYKKNNIDIKKTPNHIAIIMDGNGRWAKNKKKPRTFGHQKGVESLKTTIKAAKEFNIKYISFWAFSTENWKRPQKEVTFLISLISKLILKELPSLKKNKIYVKFYGFIDQLPKKTQDNIKKCELETKENKELQVNIMINYGSRQEIIECFKKINKQQLPITEKTISQNLLTYDIPDPDILVRTSGEYRLSNFLLWQLSYSELFFTDTMWPDFNRKNFIEILQKFSNRERRYGGL